MSDPAAAPPPVGAGSASPQEQDAPAPAPARMLDQWSGDPRFMLSLARGLLALGEVVNGRGRPVSARQIAAVTGLSLAAAQRCVYTLDALGYVRANRNGAVPAGALAKLAIAYAASSPLVWSCGPLLDALHEELDVTTSLAIFEGDAPLIVASRSSDAILKLRLPVGAQSPLHCSSSGKIYLAGLSPQMLARRIDEAELDAHTGHTITSPALLAQEVLRIRQQGFAISDQELVIGVRTAAVPVRNARGDWVASINASTMRGAVPLRALRQRVIPALLRAASQLSQLLV